MPAPGMPFAAGRDEPKEKDIVWALVDDVWCPGRVDQPDAPAPASQGDAPQDGGAEPRYCKVKFFQRLPDGKSSRVLRWTGGHGWQSGVRTAPTPVLAPTSAEVGGDSDEAMLFGRASAETAPPPPPPPPLIVAFDLGDDAKCAHPQIQESVTKLRTYFADRGGGGGGTTPTKSASSSSTAGGKPPPPSTPTPPPPSSGTSGTTTRAGPAAKALAKGPAKPPPLKMRVKPEPEDDSPLQPQPALASKAVAPQVAAGKRAAAAELRRAFAEDPYEGLADDEAILGLDAGLPDLPTAAAAPPRKAPPMKMANKSGPGSRQGPAAQAVLPRHNAAAAGGDGGRASSSGGSDDDDTPIMMLLSKASGPAAARSASAANTAKRARPPAASVAKKIPSPVLSPDVSRAAPQNGEEEQEERRRCPAPHHPELQRLVAAAPGSLKADLSRLLAVASVGPDDEVGIAGLITAVLGLANAYPVLPEGPPRTPGLFVARAVFAPALLQSAALYQSVTAAHVDALHGAHAAASTSGGGSGGGSSEAEKAQHANDPVSVAAAVSEALEHAWTIGLPNRRYRGFAAASDDDDDDSDGGVAGSAPPRQAPRSEQQLRTGGHDAAGFSLVSSLTLPTEVAAISPLLLPLMLHGNARVRAWARMQVPSLDPTLLGAGDAAAAWLLTACFTASELVPGLDSLPSATAMLMAPPLAGRTHHDHNAVGTVLRSAIAAHVPAAEIADATRELVDFVARLAPMCAHSGHAPLRHVCELALASGVCAVAVSGAGDATKAAADACGRSIAEALPLASTPKHMWSDSRDLLKASTVAAEWAASAFARLSMSTGGGPLTSGLRTARLGAIACLRRAFEPAVTALFTASQRLGRRVGDQMYKVLSPSPPVASRIRPRDAPLLLAVERLAARLKDKLVCNTSAAQLAAMGAWLHAYIALVWGTLSCGVNLSLAVGCGAGALVDLNADAYVTADGTVPPACPGHAQPHQAALAAVAELRANGASVCSPGALHGWAFDIAPAHAPLLDKMLDMKDIAAAAASTSSSASGASGAVTPPPATSPPPPPTAVARSLVAATVLGLATVDLAVTADAATLCEGLRVKDTSSSGGGAGSAAAVPPAFGLGAFWDLIKPAHRRHFRQPLLACLLLDQWSAHFRAGAESGGGVGSGAASALKRIRGVTEAMRTAPLRTPGSSATLTGFDAADTTAIALVRSLGGPLPTAASNDGARGVQGTLDSLRFSPCKDTSSVSLSWRGMNTVDGGAVTDLSAAAEIHVREWPGAAWALRRDLLHVIAGHAGTTRSREQLAQAVSDTAWAEAVLTVAAASRSNRPLSVQLVAELSAAARHAWLVVVVAVAWGTAATKRDRLVRGAVKLPQPASPALLSVMHMRAGVLLPSGVLPELLVLAAVSTPKPLPEAMLERTLGLLKTLPSRGGVQDVQQRAREADCLWLADLASGGGIYEAQAAAAQAAEVDKRFAQFEQMERQYEDQQARIRADQAAASAPRSIRDRLARAPALHAQQMGERQQRNLLQEAERKRLQAEQRRRIAAGGGGGDVTVIDSDEDDGDVVAVGPPRAAPAQQPQPHAQQPMRSVVVGGALSNVIKLPANYRIPTLPSLNTNPAAMPPPPPMPANVPARPATSGALAARDAEFEREQAGDAVDRAVVSGKAAMVRCLLATPLEGSSLYACNVTRAQCKQAAHRFDAPDRAAGSKAGGRGVRFSDALGDLGLPEVDDDAAERGAVDSYIVSAESACSVAKAWPNLESNRAIDASFAAAKGSPQARASFVTRCLPYITAEARGEVVATLRKLLQVSRSNAPSAKRGGVPEVATPGGLSEYLGLARLAKPPRTTPPALLIELTFVQDSRADRHVDARPAERASAHDIVVVNFVRADADPKPLFQFGDADATSSSSGLKRNRAEGSHPGSAAASAAVTPAGSDLDEADDDVTMPIEDTAGAARASIVAVVDVAASGAANKDVGGVGAARFQKRTITLRVSRDCPHLRAALDALSALDPSDPRTGIRVYRIASLTSANAQIEACGKVTLMPTLWPVVCDPEAHLRRSDVTAASSRLRDAVRRDPSMPPNTHFNNSQIEAMNAAVAECGDSNGTPLSDYDQGLLPFALIQGPPGTGKTHTIVGLIRRWLSAHQVRDAAGGWRTKRRVLVVAPSNIAVDEVALRLMRVNIVAKLPGGGSDQWTPGCVRIGVRDSVDREVLEAGIFLDDCIKRANGQHGGFVSGGSAGGFRAPTPATSGSGMFDRHADSRRAVIEAADVVLSTIGSLRHFPPDAFPLVVVDESAMATEPMLYSSLVYGAKRVVLVGDPAQLQATLLSPAASRRGFGRSLMERLVAAGYPCHMLDTQYRMHPDISAFPNAAFYGGRLADAPHLTSGDDRARKLPLQLPPGTLRVVFFDVGGPEQSRGRSVANPAEAEVVVGLLSGMLYELGRGALPHMGVITFYQAQVSLLRGRLAAAFGGGGAGAAGKDISVGTVDGFQGRERAGIILSCVRSVKRHRHSSTTGSVKPASSSTNASIGFVKDRHRLNVALTRAQQLCVIVGDAETLRSDTMWQGLIDHCIHVGAFLPRGAVAASVAQAKQGRPASAAASLALPRNDA